MIVVESITLVAVLAVVVAGAFRLLRLPSADVPTRLQAQRNEAHQLLQEIQIRDELLVFLPSAMRDKIQQYMTKYGEQG
jgi:hypothetical protein